MTSTRTESEVVSLLFNAAMAKDRDAFCASHALDPKLLDALRVQYAQPYIAFLEAMLHKIGATVDKWD